MLKPADYKAQRGYVLAARASIRAFKAPTAAQVYRGIQKEWRRTRRGVTVVTRHPAIPFAAAEQLGQIEGPPEVLFAREVVMMALEVSEYLDWAHDAAKEGELRDTIEICESAWNLECAFGAPRSTNAAIAALLVEVAAPRQNAAGGPTSKWTNGGV